MQHSRVDRLQLRPSQTCEPRQNCVIEVYQEECRCGRMIVVMEARQDKVACPQIRMWTNYLALSTEDKGVDETLVRCLLKIRVWMKYWCAVY